MSVRILFFAQLRDKLGTSAIEIAIDQSVTTLQSLVEHLPEHIRDPLKHFPSWQCAINQKMGTLSQAVRDGDEVAFFPPVTGG